MGGYSNIADGDNNGTVSEIQLSASMTKLSLSLLCPPLNAISLVAYAGKLGTTCKYSPDCPPSWHDTALFYHSSWSHQSSSRELLHTSISACSCVCFVSCPRSPTHFTSIGLDRSYWQPLLLPWLNLVFSPKCSVWLSLRLTLNTALIEYQLFSTRPSPTITRPCRTFLQLNCYPKKIHCIRIAQLQWPYSGRSLTFPTQHPQLTTRSYHCNFPSLSSTVAKSTRTTGKPLLEKACCTSLLVSISTLTSGLGFASLRKPPPTIEAPISPSHETHFQSIV